MVVPILVKSGQKAESVHRRLRSITVCVKPQATDNKANAAVVKLLSRELGLPRSSVHIKTGVTSRRKLIELFDTDERIALWLNGLPEV